MLSCEDLDRFPLDKPSNETFYSNEQEIIMAVNACYNYISSRIEWPWWPTCFASDMITDIQATRYSGSKYNVFKRGEMGSTHPLSSLIWEHHYAGINRVNSLLDNMDKAEETSSPEIFNRVKSEARVIRAICYMELIQKFGAVPLVKQFIDVDEALTISRTPKSEILQFIYQELDESVAGLPEKYDQIGDKGRITKGAALAMKARIALYNNDWEIAKNAAKACMDLGVYKLYPNYRDLFTYKGEYCDEIILDFQFMQTERETNTHFFGAPRNSGGQSQSFPTEDMVASFECTDGLPIDESPLYDPTNPFANRDPRIFGAIMLPRVWDGTTIKTNGTVFNGLEFMSSKEKLYEADGKTLLSSSLSEKEKTVKSSISGKTITNQEVTNSYSSFTGYCLYKYIVEENIATPNNCYQNYILCRYPEVLLTYAEACVELGQIDQSVLDAINMIRARAYGNTNSSGATDINATNYPQIVTMNQTDLRKIIRRERKVELCFEGFRLEDLKRWGLLVKALNQRKNYGRPENFSILKPTDIPQIDDDGLVVFSYAEDRYGLTNEARKMRYFEQFGNISDNYNLFPIPLGEIELNQNLAPNNPGF